MADLSVAAAQPAGTPSGRDESVRTHVRLAEAAAACGARLVLFPELSLTGYHLRFAPDDAVDPSDPWLRPLQKLADARDVVVTAGAPVAGPGGLHIGALSFVPRAGVSVYRKIHLGAGEDAAFVPGPGGAPLAVAGSAVALAICADVSHAEHADAAARAGAAVYAAGCLVDRADWSRDAERLRGAARRHGLLAVMANWAPPVPDWFPAGRSAVWSGDGTRLACAPPTGEAVVLAVRVAGEWTGTVIVPDDGKTAQ
jgi:predicted amidohydrolase